MCPEGVPLPLVGEVGWYRGFASIPSLEDGIFCFIGDRVILNNLERGRRRVKNRQSLSLAKYHTPNYEH